MRCGRSDYHALCATPHQVPMPCFSGLATSGCDCLLPIAYCLLPHLGIGIAVKEEGKVQCERRCSDKWIVVVVVLVLVLVLVLVFVVMGLRQP